MTTLKKNLSIKLKYKYNIINILELRSQGPEMSPWGLNVVYNFASSKDNNSSIVRQPGYHSSNKVPFSLLMWPLWRAPSKWPSGSAPKRPRSVQCLTEAPARARPCNWFRSPLAAPQQGFSQLRTNSRESVWRGRR